jgi:formylmethanofuran dehydrogenase subunit D
VPGRERQLQERKLTVNYLYTNGNKKPYPFIRLQGRWLERLGFTVGDKVTVTAGDGRIVIIPVKKTE